MLFRLFKGCESERPPICSWWTYDQGEQVALTIEMQLELRLSLESKETADYNGATSEFTVSVRPHDSYI